jgi:hypothetical protein
MGCRLPGGRWRAGGTSTKLGCKGAGFRRAYRDLVGLPSAATVSISRFAIPRIPFSRVAVTWVAITAAGIPVPIPWVAIAITGVPVPVARGAVAVTGTPVSIAWIAVAGIRIGTRIGAAARIFGGYGRRACDLPIQILHIDPDTGEDRCRRDRHKRCDEGVLDDILPVGFSQDSLERFFQSHGRGG